MYYDNQTGYAYRYSNSGTEENPVFFWNPISDSAVIKALTDAAAAYGLANTKAKTFTTTSNTLPSPPYKTGDLWLNATGTWGSGDAAVTWNGDILKVKANIIKRCIGFFFGDRLLVIVTPKLSPCIHNGLCLLRKN